ncbi:phage tail domain-containing protein [Paenibacillaceae bacterium WGS1546]|uniref:phage tail domain-containing protein n=1 Tax=Cohnella sp. WGS1546 TaxID=3366810 RepID=UPI00372D1DB8
MSIILNGVRDIDLGFRVLEGSEDTILPDTVDRTMAISGRQGAWYFGADLSARYFGFKCAFVTSGTDYTAPSAIELQKRVRQLATHLTDGYGKPKAIELVMERDPDKYYTVRYAGSSPIDRIMYSAIGMFTLPLVAFDPNAYLIEPILDSDIILNSDIRLSGEEYSFTVTGSTAMTVPNIGSLISRPTIIVSGNYTNLSLSANGKTFGFNQVVTNKTLTINGAALTVKLDGVNALNSITGDFIEVLPGDNQIAVSGAGLNCSITVIVDPQFL